MSRLPGYGAIRRQAHRINASARIVGAHRIDRLADRTKTAAAAPGPIEYWNDLSTPSTG